MKGFAAVAPPLLPPRVSTIAGRSAVREVSHHVTGINTPPRVLHRLPKAWTWMFSTPLSL